MLSKIIILLLCIILTEATLSQLYTKQKVSSSTLLRSSGLPTSNIACGAFCLKNNECFGFKFASLNCHLYKDIVFHSEDSSSSSSAIDELFVPDKDWLHYKPIISSKHKFKTNRVQNLDCKNYYVNLTSMLCDIY